MPVVRHVDIALEKREARRACPKRTIRCFCNIVAPRGRSMNKRWAFGIAAAAWLAATAAAIAADKLYDGVTLTLASQNDQFATVLADMSAKFKEATGVTVKVDILSYPELYTKTTADFVGHTKGYDLLTMD